MLADALADNWQLPAFRNAPRAHVTEGMIAGRSVLLLKPITYMNRAGAALAPLLELAEFTPSSDLLILVDDVALPTGAFRLRARGSDGGHNGLQSVESTLGSQDYARLRIGIGPAPEDIDDLADYVLADFEPDELSTLERLMPELTEAVDCWLHEGVEIAMNRYNRRGNESD